MNKSIRHWSLLSASPIYIAQTIAAIMPLVIAPIIIQKLGIEVFGVYSSLLIVSQVSLIISEYSFDALGPRLIAKSQLTPSNPHKTLYLKVLIAKVPLSLVGLLLGIIASRIILGRMPGLGEVTGISLMIVGTAFCGSWYLLSTNKIFYLAALIIGSKISSIIIISAFIYTSESIEPYMLFLATVVPWSVGGIIVAFKTMPRVNNYTDLLLPSLRLIKQGRVAFLGSLGGAAQNIVGALLVGTFSGPSSLGVYNAIDRIARTLSAGLKPIFQTLYPYMAKLSATQRGLARRKLVLFTRISVISGVIAYIFFDYTGLYMLTVFYGRDVASYHWLLNILIMWLIFGVLNNFIGIQGLLASGRDHEYGIGMWSGLLSTVFIGLYGVGGENYIYWVGLSVALGEVVSFTINSYSYWIKDEN